MRPSSSSCITARAVKEDPSGIEGKQLFAREVVQRGEIKVADGLHLAALSEDEYDAAMLCVNHSCEPDVGVAGSIVFVAMRDVEIGDELTTDFALFDDHDSQMRCRCGCPSCRGVVDGRDWRSPDLQLRYRRYFSWYRQQRMHRPSVE